MEEDVEREGSGCDGCGAVGGRSKWMEEKSGREDGSSI